MALVRIAHDGCIEVWLDSGYRVLTLAAGTERHGTESSLVLLWTIDRIFKHLSYLVHHDVVIPRFREIVLARG
jgi:hypothetical protein